MIELKPQEFGICHPLFRDIEYSLSIQAAIEGNNPGRIFVDNKAQPNTALALTVEGYHLAGVNKNPATKEALRRLFIDNFLEKAVSVCILHDHQIVSWCTPDCTAGDRIDVGIITDPAHRRLGLAAIAVAATAEMCFDQGFNAIGWHCNADNTASWKTAEKVGFQEQVEAFHILHGDQAWDTILTRMRH